MVQHPAAADRDCDAILRRLTHLVRDGQRVRAGDVLIELDPTISEAELGHLEGDLVAVEIEIARLRAALAGSDDPVRYFVPPDRATPAQIAMGQRFLSRQVAEQSAKIAAIQWQGAQKKAERATTEATIAKVETIIPILQQRVDVRKYLVDKEFGSKLQYLSDMTELVGQQQDLLVQKSRHGEVEAALAALEETRLRTQAEYDRSLFDDLAKAEQKAAALRHDVIKARQRTSLFRLTAQQDAVVQQLVVHSVGGVVTPAQTLMVLVPANSKLEIEAMVSNRDIGFVVPGQIAAIKLDTFNFTRYGLRKGEVLSVSQDAITRDRPVERNGDKGGGSETTSSEPKGQELVYSARISLDSPDMQVDDRLVRLSPGMAVTVEIKTGSRCIIAYLLSPLLRYSQESLRER